MLVVRSLTKSFDEKPVLTGLDLTVQPGEILFLTGPSGAGKSTALRAIANLDSYDAGHVSVDGHTPSSTGFSEWRRDVMYVPQTRISYPCTPRHLFERALNFKSRALMHFNLKESLERYVEICCQLGLDRPNIEQQKWTELSGGQAQRAMVGLCIAMHPKVLLLDEPSSSCDHQSALLVERAIVASGITSVWVSHDRGQPARVGGRIQGIRDP